jgi:hypothetical protein
MAEEKDDLYEEDGEDWPGFQTGSPSQHDCMEGVEVFLGSGGLVWCVKQSRYDR